MRALVWILTMALSITALAAPPQEETFTEIVPGSDLTNPDKLIPLLERGDVRAMNNIGLLWAHGVGVPAPNYGEAMRWWKEAARRGYAVSMNNIGLLYANGQGVAQDYKQALKWWEMAAERGNAWAMNSVGDLYETGAGVDRDYAKAIDWYRRAADAGDGLAMYNLGNLYELGHGLDQSYRSAYEWYSKSADKGIASAMHKLGKLFAEGRGFPADLAEAFAWHTVAARYYTSEDKDENEANRLEVNELNAKLSADEQVRATELVKNLTERIEERRRVEPATQPKPGETET